MVGVGALAVLLGLYQYVQLSCCVGFSGRSIDSSLSHLFSVPVFLFSFFRSFSCPWFLNVKYSEETHQTMHLVLVRADVSQVILHPRVFLIQRDQRTAAGDLVRRPFFEPDPVVCVYSGVFFFVVSFIFSLLFSFLFPAWAEGWKGVR